MNVQDKLNLIGALALSILLIGCGGGGGVDNPGVNDAPAIAGKSIDYVRSGKEYLFTPLAFDPENDELRYRIENKPPWAEFDPLTGSLRGIPDDSFVGQYEEIIISVSDGDKVVSLPPFMLKVMYAEVGRNNVQIDPNAAVTNMPDGYEVIGDAAIVVGGLVTDFKDADLQFEYDDEGNLLDLFGETDLPPAISDTLSVVAGARAVVGLYSGAEINDSTTKIGAVIGPDSDPGILLRDEFRYLVYFLDTNVELLFHGLAADVEVPLAGTQTLIITDPTDPMFYYFGEIAGFAAGYGKSFNGNIPYEPLFDPAGPVAFSQLEPFHGTDVLKGTFPITVFKVFDLLELSGTAICAPPQLLDCDKPSPLGLAVSLADALLLQGGIDPEQQFKVGINGTAEIAFRIFGIDLFSYHLFDMASQIDVGTVRQKLAIQGVIDPAESDSPGWIPIKPVPDPGVVMVGNLFADVDAVSGLGDFGISLYGEFPSTFPAATISGSIDINPQGLQFRGTVADPENPITVTATADIDEFSAGIEFGYDFNSQLDAVVDGGIERGLVEYERVTQDLQNAIGAYDLAFSLDGFRENIPTLVDTIIGVLNGVPQTVYNSVYNGVYDGIRSKSYTYNPCSPVTNCSITLYARDYVNEASIARNAANDAKSKTQGTVNARIAELNELKAQAQEIEDGPVFRSALKTALETVAAHDKISVAVPKQTITVDFVVTTKTYTVFSATTITRTVFNNELKQDLQLAAANVENIDPAQTFMFNTQQIFDQLPTADELNQVAQDVSDGLVELPLVNGGGYTVARSGEQFAYVLLDDQRIEIAFNPLDPAAAITGVGDTIASYLAR